MLAGVCAQNFPLRAWFCYDKDRAVWDGYLSRTHPLYVVKTKPLPAVSVIQEFQPPGDAIELLDIISWNGSV